MAIMTWLESSAPVSAPPEQAGFFSAGEQPPDSMETALPPAAAVDEEELAGAQNLGLTI